MAETPAGWYPDPYGRHELRYFDGTTWGEHVSDAGRQGTDPIGPDTPVLAPRSPVEAQAPAAPAGAALVATVGTPTVIVKHRSRWPWVILGIFIFFGLLFVGCAVLVGVGINEAAKEINEEQERHAISQSQFEAVTIGTPKADVIAALGKEPETTSSFESEASGDFDISSDCIYYWESGETFGNWYHFCFDSSGNLRSKSQS